jgi:hypothetical protein
VRFDSCLKPIRVRAYPVGVTTVIDLDALKTTETLLLGQRAQVEIRELDGAGEIALHDALVRPGHARPGSFANELLSRCSGLTGAQVQSLNPAHRRRVIAAVVRVNDWQQDWTALYGSHLGADERLLAVASWGYKRSHSAVIIRLREIRQQQVQDAKRQAAALGAAQLAPISEVVAKSQQVLAAQRQARKAGGALANFHEWMRLGATPTLLAATRPNPLFAAAMRPNPLFAAMIKPPSLLVTPAPSVISPLRHAAGLSDAVAGLERTRATIISATRGLARPKLSIIAPIHPSLGAIMGGQGLAHALAGTKTLVGFSESLRTTILGGGFADLVSGRMLANLDPLRVWRETFDWAVVDQFLAAWENHALWYLFSSLGIGASAKLGNLPRDEVEPVVFEALERVFSDPELLDAFILQLGLVPDLAGPHRDQMRQALEFARDGQYHLAQPLLHVAFESMLYQGALRQGLVQPSQGKISAAESLLKILFTSGDLFLNFTVRMVFGGVGNSYRHGRNPDGHRELMLAGMVALAGYMDWTTSSQAVELIAERMERQLDPAIDSVQSIQPAALLRAAGLPRAKTAANGSVVRRGMSGPAGA